MLSRVKATSYAAAATLVILTGLTAVPTVATAQNIQLAQADRRDGDNRREARRESRRDNARSERRDNARAERSRNTSRTVVRRDRDNDRRVVVRSGRDNDRRIVVRSRDNDRWRDARRSYAATTIAFSVLGPRVVYRTYGPGWCRGLHRGRHFDRRGGWHAGRHYGPFRC